jgi:hypothetical protein
MVSDVVQVVCSQSTVLEADGLRYCTIGSMYSAYLRLLPWSQILYIYILCPEHIGEQNAVDSL